MTPACWIGLGYIAVGCVTFGIGLAADGAPVTLYDFLAAIFWPLTFFVVLGMAIGRALR